MDEIDILYLIHSNFCAEKMQSKVRKGVFTAFLLYYFLSENLNILSKEYQSYQKPKIAAFKQEICHSSR